MAAFGKVSAIMVKFAYINLEGMESRKVCIVTGTRAEWGLLSNIAGCLREREGVQLQIVATNMHLDPLYGHTLDEILADGFDVDCKVEMPSEGDNHRAKVKAKA